MIPEGVEGEPGRGNHRSFNYRQAFWLAIVLKLKAAGIQPKRATEIARWAERIRGFAQNAVWDWTFAPFDGQYTTDRQWYLEIGDGTYVRFLSDANPSREGLGDESGWVHMQTRTLCPDAHPVVLVRLDLSQLAALLAEKSDG
jgi:hypothetical protein